MKRRIKSHKGFFGQLIHYEDGIKIGESWPGLFEGSYEHYDANGKYVGYSDPGIVVDLIHHDEHGGYADTDKRSHIVFAGFCEIDYSYNKDDQHNEKGKRTHKSEELAICCKDEVGV